jgi:hypothetical protein
MTFKCAHCGGVFPDSPEQEARAVAERQQHYPGIPADECDVLCDGCYRLFEAWRIANALPRVVSTN